MYLAASFFCVFVHDLLLTWKTLPSFIYLAYSNSSFKAHLDRISSMKGFHGNPDRVMKLWLVPQHQNNTLCDMIPCDTNQAGNSEYLWVTPWEKAGPYFATCLQVQLERENNISQTVLGIWECATAWKEDTVHHGRKPRMVLFLKGPESLGMTAQLPMCLPLKYLSSWGKDFCSHTRGDGLCPVWSVAIIWYNNAHVSRCRHGQVITSGDQPGQHSWHYTVSQNLDPILRVRKGETPSMLRLSRIPLWNVDSE